jgi:inorganic pyrophosphatase
MSDVSYGKDAPQVINVIIEIKKGEKNKYEFDKESGRLFLDRVNGTLLGYPADYGYVPNTLCDDGDPLDALLIIDESVPHGVVVPSRPIGVLYFEDDGKMDEKLIVVPADKDWKKDWQGVPGTLHGWGGAAAAKEVIAKAIAAAKQ